MSLKKSVSILMIASQIAGISLASAAAPTPHTAEWHLLQHVLALQGQKQVSDAVSAYLATAPQADRQQHFQEALVDLGVYTPDEAASFVAEAQQTGLNENEISHLASLHPMGAQFSSCTVTGVGALMTVVGGLGFLVALAGPHYSNDASCGEIPCSQQDYYHSDSERNTMMITTGIITAVGAILLLTGGSCS